MSTSRSACARRSVFPVAVGILVVREDEESRAHTDVVADLPGDFTLGARTVFADGVFAGIDAERGFVHALVEAGLHVPGEGRDGGVEREGFLRVGIVVGHTDADVKFAWRHEGAFQVVGIRLVIFEKLCLEGDVGRVVPPLRCLVAQESVDLEEIFRHGIAVCCGRQG